MRGLTQAQLDGFIGDAGTLLPDRPPRDTGEPFHVWTCWTQPPEGFEALVARDTLVRLGLKTEDDLRQEWLCPQGTRPQKTGTPLPLDAPRPEGHPLGPD